MSGAPLVSVVVPAFNSERYVADALKSVLNQTLEDFELLVVDDGSSDNTSDVIARFSDRRLDLIRQSNSGLAAARNVGISAANGTYVSFLDADDVWLPDKLAAQVDLLDSHATSEVCFTYFDEVDDSLTTRTPWSQLATKYERMSVDAETLVTAGNVVAGSGSSVMARTDAVRAVGGFDTRLVAAEDLDLWYRLALRADLAAVPRVLVKVRRSDRGQMQSDKIRVLQGRVQFLMKVMAIGAPSHRIAASRLERQLRRQCLRSSLRQGRLKSSGEQALALVTAKRLR